MSPRRVTAKTPYHQLYRQSLILGKFTGAKRCTEVWATLLTRQAYLGFVLLPPSELPSLIDAL